MQRNKPMIWERLALQRVVKMGVCCCSEEDWNVLVKFTSKDEDRSQEGARRILAQG